MKCLLQSLALLLLAAPAWAEVPATELQTVHMPTLDPEDPPAVMLYTTPGMEPLPPPPPPGQSYSPPEYEHNRVQVAAWMDGRVVWSHNLERGGSPYYTGKIDPVEVKKVYQVLSEETSGTEQKLTSYTIPDASFQTILMLSSDRKRGIEWQSVQPIVVRSDRKTTYTIHGLVSTATYKAPEQPSEEEINLHKFFTDFSHLRAAILSLPPSKRLKFE